MEPLPGSSGCFVCDNDAANPRSLRLKLMWNEEDGTVSIPFKGDESWCGYGGVIHGGILACIFDDAMAWAVHKGSNEWGVTASFNIRYRKPVLAGQEYLAKGKVESQKGRKAKTSAQILDLEGNVMAEADALFIGGTSVRIREKEMQK